MKTIRLEKLSAIQEDLDSLEDGEMLYVEDEFGDPAYVLMPMSNVVEASNLFEQAMSSSQPHVQIMTPQNLPPITYEEYEKIKEQILKALDETFKPNPEKLN